MRSLRWRLFTALLFTVLVATGISLAIGIVFTRQALRDSIQEQLAREADLLATRVSSLPGGSNEDLERPPPAKPPPRSTGAPKPPPRSSENNGAKAPPPRPSDAPPPPSRLRPQVITLVEAAEALPTSAIEQIRKAGRASGKTKVGGHTIFFEARKVVGSRVLLVRRPARVGADDLRPYLGGLSLASVIGILLAALAAWLVSRRLSAPLRLAAEASRSVASGQRPEPLPSGRIRELSVLAEAFNDMTHQLEQARAAERSVLLSVSHELRTPLTAIRGYAEGVEDGTIESPKAAAVISAEAARLERLVQDLLALARLDQGVLEVRAEPVDLVAVVEQVRHRLAIESQRRELQLDVHCQGDARAVADHDRVLQVVSNLVENALRVTPPGGRVDISVKPGQITVADTGPGIPAEDLPHAFERFHLRRRHGRGSADGSGVGLAIVRELTEAMGGQVKIESHEGQGAKFTVTLPQ